MAVKGTLQDMSLHDLVQFFRKGPKSGVLLLLNDSVQGIAYIAWGQMIDALIVQGKDHKVIKNGAEAAIEMFTWEKATFSFRHTTTTHDRPIHIHCEEELLEEEASHRLACLAAAPTHGLITLDDHIVLKPLPPGGADTSVSLDVTQWRIISMAHECQSLRAICQTADIDQETAIRAVYRLVAVGLIEVIQQPPPVLQTASMFDRTYRKTVAA